MTRLMYVWVDIQASDYERKQHSTHLENQVKSLRKKLDSTSYSVSNDTDRCYKAHTRHQSNVDSCR